MHDELVFDASQKWPALHFILMGVLLMAVGAVPWRLPRSGHKEERFTVRGVPFSFSDYTASPGFNQTR